MTYSYAIAYAVLEHLIRHIGCATLFSTHYHMLTDEFANNPNVSLKHMSCIVDDEQYVVPWLVLSISFGCQTVHHRCRRQCRKQVVYLYKIAPGVCPKSHGMSVALTAGLQQEVVDSAYRAADNFELASYAAAYAQASVTHERPRDRESVCVWCGSVVLLTRWYAMQDRWQEAGGAQVVRPDRSATR